MFLTELTSKKKKVKWLLKEALLKSENRTRPIGSTEKSMNRLVIRSGMYLKNREYSDQEETGPKPAEPVKTGGMIGFFSSCSWQEIKKKSSFNLAAATKEEEE